MKDERTEEELWAEWEEQPEGHPDLKVLPLSEAESEKYKEKFKIIYSEDRLGYALPFGDFFSEGNFIRITPKYIENEEEERTL